MIRCFLALILAAALHAHAAANAQVIDIVGYVPEYRARSLDIDYAFSMVTDIVLFSIEPSVNPKNRDTMIEGIGDGGRFPPPSEVWKKMLDAKKRFGTRISIGLGGSGRSSAFVAVLSEKTLRQRFVDTLVKKVIEPYELDGVDINWQFPGAYKDYVLLASLVEDLRPHCKRISVAYRPFMNPNQAKMLHDAGVDKVADRFMAMAYDIFLERDHHASYNSGVRALQEAEKAGLPKEKVLLGLPFYARGIKNTGDVATFEEIVLRAAVEGTVEYSEVSDQVKIGNVDRPTAPKREMAFNCHETVRSKALYTMEHGYAGVAIWELGQDCRMHEVKHDFEGGAAHAKTCKPGHTSLLSALDQKDLQIQLKMKRGDPPSERENHPRSTSDDNHKTFNEL